METFAICVNDMAGTSSYGVILATCSNPTEVIQNAASAFYSLIYEKMSLTGHKQKIALVDLPHFVCPNGPCYGFT